jgi:hypothetical protein
MAATLQSGGTGHEDHDVAAAFPAPADKFSDLNLVADALLRDLRPYRGAVPFRRVELQADLITWAQRQWEEIARRAEDACWNTARRLKRVGVPLCLELSTDRDFTSILFLRKSRRANGSSAISPNTASVNSNDPIAQLEAQTTIVMTIATAAPPTDSSAANDVRGTIGAPSSTRAWFEEQLTAAASEGREGSKKRLVAQERLALYRLLTLMAAATGGRAEPAACCIVGDVLYLAVGASAVPKNAAAAAAAPRADADIIPKLGDILDDVSHEVDAHLRDSASRVSAASACMTAADALDELFLPLTDRRLGDRGGEEEEGVLLTTTALHLAQRYDALRGLTAAAAVADEDDATVLQELDALSQVAARVRGLRRLRDAIAPAEDGPHRNGSGGYVQGTEDEAVLMQTVEAVAARLAASELDLLDRYQLFLERHATQARRVDDTWSRWTQPLDRIKRIDLVVLPTTVSAAHTTRPQLNAEVQLYLYLRQMQRDAIEAPEFAPPQAAETRALYRAPTFEMASVIIATTHPTCAASTLFFHGGVAVPVVDDAGAHAAKMQAEHFSPRRKAQMLLDTSVPWMPPATVEPSATAVHTNDNHSIEGAAASEGQQQHEGGFTMSAGDWQRIIHTLQRATSWTPR